MWGLLLGVRLARQLGLSWIVFELDQIPRWWWTRSAPALRGCHTSIPCSRRFFCCCTSLGGAFLLLMCSVKLTVAQMFWLEGGFQLHLLISRLLILFVLCWVLFWRTMLGVLRCPGQPSVLFIQLPVVIEKNKDKYVATQT